MNRTFKPAIKQTLIRDRQVVRFEVKGEVPIHYNGSSKSVQIKILIPDSYPDTPPSLEVVPGDNKLKGENLEIFLPGTYKWDYENNDLTNLMKEVISKFSEDFPFEDKNTSGLEIDNKEDPVLPIIKMLHQTKDIFVKKSVSNHISLLQGTDETSWKRLMKTNNRQVSPEMFLNAINLATQKDSIALHVEPMYLHVQCKNINIAKLICALAIKSKYNNSGIIFASSGNIYVVVRSADNFKVPVTSSSGNLILTNETMSLILTEAKDLLKRDDLRAIQFQQALIPKFGIEENGNQKILSESVSSVAEQCEGANNEAKPTLVGIPDNLLLHILDKLSPSCLHRCRQVCKKLNNFIVEKIWRSNSGLERREEILKQNWRERKYNMETNSYDVNFHFPELMSSSNSAYVLYENFKNRETLAVIDLHENSVWVIEEPQTRLTTSTIKLNETLLALYKQKDYSTGVIKVYSLKNRRAIYEANMDSFLELLVDEDSSEAVFLILTKDVIKVFVFDEFLQSVQTFQIEADFITRPLFNHYSDHNLSYGYQTSLLQMCVWRINFEEKTIEAKQNIEDFELFAGVAGPRSTVHNAIYFERKFIIHACVYEEEGNESLQACVIKVMNEDGSFVRNFLMDDFYEQCMGDIQFIISKERGLFVERKYHANGLFHVNIDNDIVVIVEPDDEVENLSPTPINLTATRLDMLDQYDEDNSFFLRRVRTNFVVHKTFLASVSLRHIKEDNVFKKYVFMSQKANYWI